MRIMEEYCKKCKDQAAYCERNKLRVREKIANEWKIVTLAAIEDSGVAFIRTSKYGWK